MTCRSGDGENNCVCKYWKEKLLLEIWNNFVPFIMNRIPALIANCKQKAKNKEAFLTWHTLDSLLNIITTTAHKKDGGRLLGGSPRHVEASCNPGRRGSSLRQRGILIVVICKRYIFEREGVLIVAWRWFICKRWSAVGTNTRWGISGLLFL